MKTNKKDWTLWGHLQGDITFLKLTGCHRAKPSASTLKEWERKGYVELYWALY